MTRTSPFLQLNQLPRKTYGQRSLHAVLLVPLLLITTSIYKTQTTEYHKRTYVIYKKQKIFDKK